jgi:hypothetical protein
MRYSETNYAPLPRVLLPSPDGATFLPEEGFWLAYLTDKSKFEIYKQQIYITKEKKSC